MIAFKYTNNRGFSLLELILAIAIFSLSSIAMGTLLIDSNVSTRINYEKTEALFYAKEGLEAARSIRDNSWTNWAALADGNYGLEISSSSWTFASTSNLIDDKYTRTINITSSSTATSTKFVTSTVNWDTNNSRNMNVALTTMFTNWTSVVNSTSQIPTDGLVSYWSFDGNADDSVSGYNGTVSGASLTTGVKGLADTAYSFNGSSNYISTTALDGWPDGKNFFSISVWVKYTTVKQMNIAGWWYYHYNTVHVNSSGYLVATAETTNGQVYHTSPGAYNDGLWHHIVGVYDGSNVILYVDGSPISSPPAQTGLMNDTDDRFAIGITMHSSGTPSTEYFDGSIDNVRLYDRALTEEEVATIYNEEKP